jgi:CoA-transferase family III
MDAADTLRRWVAPLCPELAVAGPAGGGPAGGGRCAVLGWAASGAMALTGYAGRAPVASAAGAFALLAEVSRTLARVTGGTGTPVHADPAAVLTVRAALRGLSRNGSVSAGGTTRLLRAADGWCAVTLSRPEDAASVPAIVGIADVTNPWRALETAARQRTTAGLAARAQLLGVPAATLRRRARPAAAPWRLARIAAAGTSRCLRGAVVADLSAMWAGPLCARLLGQAGAEVIKVESTRRPDGARTGDPRFFGWLHAGHRSVRLDFGSAAGRAALAGLLEAADVVIEASRPRALAQLGLGPGMLAHRAGQVWVSITGDGRDQAGLVAFGDDAAVAGGLVGWDEGEPVFCADAIADPLAGMCAALAASAAVMAGGGQLIDVSMSAAAAAFAAAATPCHGPHPIRRAAGGWQVRCAATGRSQPVLPPRIQAPANRDARAAAPGADTGRVLDWLGGRGAGSRRC